MQVAVESGAGRLAAHGIGGKYRSEIGSLEAAMGETGLRDSTLVTLGEEFDVELSTGTLHVIPAWKWFLAK